MNTAEIALPRAHAWPLTRLDVAGAFGDIGILFPIAIALVTLNHLNPTAVFLGAGLTYILTGWYFQIPLAVEPLKAVAAIALAMTLPPSAIASAGLLMGAVLAFIGITNLAASLAKLFTLPIVRGIQLGLGLLLAREGLRLIVSRQSVLGFSGGYITGRLGNRSRRARSSCLLSRDRAVIPPPWLCSELGLCLVCSRTGGNCRHSPGGRCRSRFCTLVPVNSGEFCRCW